MVSPKRSTSRKSMAHPPSSQTPSVIEDKENVTTDVNALSRLKASASDAHGSDRRTRSKSLGATGLEALRDGTGNRRKTAAAPPRSILKPSIPLSPLREIPSRAGTTSARNEPSPATTPRRNRLHSPATAAVASPIPSPGKLGSSPGKGSPIKTAGFASPRSQRAVDNGASYLEAREKRQREREAIQKQREARRKSMANRRVSFAPEATLHTWDHIEDNQDSTTSSASTDSTRRASSTSAMADDPPSTPPHQLEDDTVQESPVHQRDLHQKQQRRKSSGIPPMNFNNPEDEPTSTTYTSVSIPSGQAHGDQDQPDDQTDSDSTSSHRHQSPEQRRNATPKPARSIGQWKDDLETAEENGELTMEMADDDVTAAFQPWAQQISQSRSNSAELAVNADQENVNPFSPAFSQGKLFPQISSHNHRSDRDDDEPSMDITRAIGGIVHSEARPSQSLARRQSAIRTQNSSSDSNLFGDDTMDFTGVVGGIKPNSIVPTEASLIDQNEELSMEFTSVFGGIQPNDKSKAIPQRTGEAVYQHAFENLVDTDGDTEMTMDFEIINEEQASEILQDQQFEATATLNSEDKPQNVAANTSKIETLTAPDTKSAGPGEEGVNLTPSKSPQTPSKQITPQPTRPLIPNKLPTPQNITMRTPSPRRLFRNEIKLAQQSPNPPPSQPSTQDQAGNNSNVQIAQGNLSHRISGTEFDRKGLGSPRVADLLDRRGSIGDQADVFTLQSLESRSVHFQNARALNEEVTKDQDEIERRESGQFILEKEAGAHVAERDNTVSLKGAIESMTPQKNRFKGRKSLATGSAKGLLGKRPAELDEEDDNNNDDEEGTPQGLKGRQASPVKRIKLQAPPSASETTGKSMSRKSMGPGTEIDRPFTPIHHSPIKKGAATTPSHKGHFKDAAALPSAQKPLPALGQTDTATTSESVRDSEEERIHLQDFLNMTNIRFMELNTTKRRHTAVTPAKNAITEEADEVEPNASKSFADAVVAGACTLPMLELFQHSCRELKKYISEGRKVVREIESNTYEDNPPLFREYMSASPEDRSVMDNQFKNMKTHARLLSKGMWYEWRTKLLDGLSEGLLRELEGLKRDKIQLDEQSSSLEKTLPSVREEHAALENEYDSLQARAHELANCDQEELRDARQQILSIDEQIRYRRQQVEKLQARSKDLEGAVEDATDAKTEAVEAIKHAQRMLSEHRGWSLDEVNKYKANVDALEAESGWSIVSCSGTQLTMEYRTQIQLVFDVAAFLPAAISTEHSAGNSSIRLCYVADQREHRPEALTVEKRFFLQLMQAHLQCLERHEVQAKDLLHFVSAGWTRALELSEEIRRLNLENLTASSILSDERLAVRSSMLLPDVQTKVNVWFEIAAATRGMDIVVKLHARAEVVYGEQYREDKMGDFLQARLDKDTDRASSRGSWAVALRELKAKLIARGRK